MPEATLETIMLALERLQGDVSAVREEQAGFHKELAGLREEQAGFRKELAGLREEQVGIRKELTGLREEQAGLREGQSGLREEQAGLREEQAGLRKEQVKLLEEYTRLRTELMARLDRLQDSLTLTRDDIVVNFGASDRIENIARSASNEVRALAVEFGGLRRQVQHLQSEVRALRGEP